MLVVMDKKEKLECPYCAIFALFEFGESKKIAITEVRETKCPNCGKAVIQSRDLNPTLVDKGEAWIANPGKWVIVWPRLRLICVDEKVPSEIRSDLNRAYSISTYHLTRLLD